MTESVVSPRAPWRWRWALPLLPIAASMFCLSALVYYHAAMGGHGEAWGFFQGIVVGFYRWLGFVPTFMFWLLLFVWCSIWFVTGTWERVRTRLLWMVAFTLSLAILVNLGTPADAPPPHAGIIGTYIAVRLSSVIGYAFSALLAVGASLAALLLATDFLFYRYFESLARGQNSEDAGVEPEATDAFRELAFGGVYAEEPKAAPAGAAAAPGYPLVDEDTLGQDLARAIDSDIVVRPRRRYARPIEELAATRLGDTSLLPVEATPVDAAPQNEVAAVDTSEMNVDDASASEVANYTGGGAPWNAQEPAAEAIAGDEPAPADFDLPPLPNLGPVVRPYVAERESDESDNVDIGVEAEATEPVVPIPRTRRNRHRQMFEAEVTGANDNVDRAAREVLAAGRASVTLLRRSLQCSPAEALALLDELRRAGVVDGEAGSPHGRVLTTLADWEAR